MKLLPKLLLAALFLAIGSVQASPLYITQYSGTSGAIVETSTGAVIGTFTTTESTETGIAVNGTIRIIAGFIGDAGSEYDLSGNVINSGIYPNTGYDSLYDGTTDGEYNYSIDHNGSFDVIRFDENWENSTILFKPARASGIAYDALSNSLWITTSTDGGAPNGNIQQFSMTGELLSEFSTSAIGGNHYGLAFDSADGTLWTSNFGSSTLSQFDTSGNLLQELDMSALGFTSFFGLEFKFGGEFEQASLVPVPTLSAWMLLLLVLIIGITGFSARRKRLTA